MPSVLPLVLSLLLQTATAGPAPAADRLAPDPRAETGTRQVRVTPLSIVSLRAHLRFSTLIVLPAEERILEVHAGDKEYWQVSVPAPTEHTVSIKPSKAGASTNIDLFCASGNVYSFLITDVSLTATPAADLKVFVEADDTMRVAGAAPPKYVNARELAHCQAQTADTVARAQATLDRTLAEYPARLQFGYRFDRRAPFLIDAIWRDDTHTYLRTRATELPALYELKDGRAGLVPFTVTDQDRASAAGGPSRTYVVPKLLDAGYLAIGDKRSAFRLERR